MRSYIYRSHSHGSLCFLLFSAVPIESGGNSLFNKFLGDRELRRVVVGVMGVVNWEWRRVGAAAGLGNVFLRMDRICRGI